MKKLFLTIAIISIIGFLAYSYFQVFVKNKNSFDQANTTLKIEGQETMEIGDTADFVISYKNNNKANLKNTVLVLNFFGEGFGDIKDNYGSGIINNSSITWTIGDIAAGFENGLKVSAKITDVAANKLSVSFDYDPDNFSSHFSVKKDYSFTVNPAKISLNFNPLLEAVMGQEIKYTLIYTNATAINFDSVRIKFNYPKDFIFSSANPPASEGGFWEISNFARASIGQIEIAGRLNGNGGETKTIGAVAEQKNKDGGYAFNNEATADTKIISSPFSIVEIINDKENYSASAGETLNYKIKFRNLDNVNYNNLIVSVNLEGEAADYTMLEASGAIVDKQLRSVTWDSKSKPAFLNFKPDQEAELNFSVKIQNILPAIDANSKNFTVKSVINIKNGNIFDAEGANKIIVSSALETKINSSAMLFTRGFFNDNDLLKTSGSIPPKVGQITTYNIHWQILNTSNKIKNAKVIGVLPANVKWTGNIFPFDAKIFYDINNRSITWEAGDIEVGTGIISPLKEVLFQVSVEPAASDVGNYLTLIDQNSLSAADEFTLSDISVNSDGITTRLPDDLSIGPNEGMVAQ